MIKSIAIKTIKVAYYIVMGIGYAAWILLISGILLYLVELVKG